MAITGVHTLFYTSEPEKLRAVLRDVFGLKFVDAGEGWLIFGLPPAELGVHPAEGLHGEAGRHMVSFMCDDIQATVKELRSKGIPVIKEPTDEGYGISAIVSLPGGVAVQVYQPRHPLATGL